VLQSRGDDDPWRCSRTLLADALEAGIDRAPLDEHEPLPYASRTLERLTDLGVLDGWADDAGEVSRYDLQGSMRDVAQAVLDGGPWQAAVAALVDDERAVIFQGPGPTASDATIEQTRMIAHEVRNALVPVRHHIDALLATPAEVPASGRIEAARRGVVRVLTFVDEMVATSELVDEPARPCELADVVSEALGWIDGGERIEVGGAGKGIQLRVPRTRLARAISNLLLNALQATTASQRVRVSVAETDAAVEIIVDDAGAGVPRTQRRRVFDDGFTMRAGGSGYGLAFVRSVVERELHGEVWCDASELGGARFVITIPKVVEQ
jgi:signal transduction histidine kinase